ncbi:nucleotide sugar dehydrogenase [Pelosinus sp. UFO1]|nr:nucleotide sugar dehydrogenase [Pelosinus sp. UFO1]
MMRETCNYFNIFLGGLRLNTVSIIGTGYVGLVTGTCLSEFGMQVTCMDVDQGKINRLKQGEIPIYEPGLDSLVQKNYKAGRIKFTTDIKVTVEDSKTIFIAVGTPPQEDGSADLQYVLAVAKAIAENMNSYKVIVDKSTVPVGTGQKVKKVIQEVLDQRGVDIDFDVVSNPEFLREGSAVRDFMHPDRIVIGSESETAKNVMKNIYNVLYLIETPFVFTSIETAELIKYAANAFLATKITFINEIANLCDIIGADVHDVAKAMGLDGRISKYFLHPGPGYGGSCFPKDTKALVNIGQQYDVNMSLVDTVVTANENQKKHMVYKIERKMGNLDGKVFGILGLAFKPQTDDMRDAPSITIIKELLAKGATVRVYDPVAMENAKVHGFEDIKSIESIELLKMLGVINVPIIYCQDEYDAVDGVDAIVILTEWNQFRSLNLTKIEDLMQGNYFFDFRNIYDRKQLEELGFIYEGVGK